MRVAAIDIGTNSVHMIVAKIRPDLSFEVIDREKDMIRLGAGGLGGRELSEPAIETALQTMARFRRLADSHDVDEIIATATSAVREAENGGDFIEAVRRRTKIDVRVISGTEEAKLIHLAAAYAVDIGAHPAVVIDIGGGSVEITLGTSARQQLGRSFKLGVIRLTEKFVKTDPLSARDGRRLVKHIRREAGEFLGTVSRRRFERVIGTSGTILALGAAALSDTKLAGDMRNMRVPAKALHRLRKRLTGMPLGDRLKMDGLDPGRADLSVAGSVLLDELLTAIDATDVTLCDFALREGLVLDYIARNAAHIRKVDRYPDVRRRSVIELAERCNYLMPHAQQVARLSLALFDQTRRVHELGDREREWLEFAALLHDIGMHISYERHHKHAYYLIRNGGLRGFDPEEVEVIAQVARYHRQARPKRSHVEFAELPRGDQRTVTILSAMLRLAEGLDRSHAQSVTGLTLTTRQSAKVIRLQTRGDAELELWAAHRHAAALADCLDAEIVFDLPMPRRRARPRIRRKAARRK